MTTNIYNIANKIIFNIRKNYLVYLFLIIIVIISFSLARYVMTHVSLDEDEILSWRISKSSFALIFENTIVDTQMPLYYLTLKIFTGPFGNLVNDYWIRFPSFIYFILTIIILYLYGIKIKLPPIFSFLSILPAMFHNELCFFATYVRPYSFLILLIVLNLLSLLTVISVQFRTIISQKELSIAKYCFHISLPLIAFTHHLFTIYICAIIIIIISSKKTVQLVFKNLIHKKSLLFHFLWLIGIYIPCLTYQYLNAAHNLSWINQKSLSELIQILEQLSFHHSAFNNLTFIILIGIGIISFLFFNKNKPIFFIPATFFIKYFISISIIFYVVSNVIQPLLIRRYFIIAIPSLFIVIILVSSYIHTCTKSFKKVLASFFLFPFFIPLFPSTIPFFHVHEKIYLKHFIRNIGNDVLNENNLLCLTVGDYVVKGNENSSVFSMYSQMYHKKNICKKTIPINNILPKQLRNYDHILYYYNHLMPNHLKAIIENNFEIMQQCNRNEKTIYLLENKH